MIFSDMWIEIAMCSWAMQNMWNSYFNVLLQVVKLISVKIYEITSLKYMKLLFAIYVICNVSEICIEMYEITYLKYM